MKTHKMEGNVVRNIPKVESTGFANRLINGGCERNQESKDDTTLFGLRPRQKALSFTEMGKIQEEHLERKMRETRVPGEWCLDTLPG